MAATKGSGWLVKASCEGNPNIQITGLRPQRDERGAEGGPGFHELVQDLADSFDLIPASVMLFSLHQGTKLSVHLGSQGDLDVVLAEALEYGSHVVAVTVSGIPARRALDAVGALLSVAATVSQLFYLSWIVTSSGAGFYYELKMWVVVVITVLYNLGSYFYLVDDESDKNHPFRLWMRPLFRRLGMLLLAPFTGDVLPLVACKVCARAARPCVPPQSECTHGLPLPRPSPHTWPPPATLTRTHIASPCHAHAHTHSLPLPRSRAHT